MTAYRPIDFNKLTKDCGDIPQMIEDLRDPFLEMYQREKALAAWPDYEFVIKLTKSQGFARTSTGAGSEFPGPRSRHDQQYPSRPSNILPFYVPEDATGAHEQAIDVAARADAGTAVGEIRTAFNEVLEDGSLAAADTLLQKLSKTSASVDDLITTHDRNGFEKVTHLFEGWRGHDSEKGMEQFGAWLRPAAGDHRVIAAQLIQGAAAECAAKLTAQTQLGKALKEVHANIDQLKTGTNPSLNIIVRTLFQKVPEAGFFISLIDDGLETIGVEEVGGVKGRTPVNDWFTAMFNKFDIHYEMALEPQKGSVLRRELLKVAEECKTALKSKRDEASTSLGIDQGTWAAKLSLEPRILIPGEPNH
jgi:hypothetical protein